MLDVKNLFESDFDLVKAKELMKEIQKEEKGLLKRLSLEKESMVKTLNKAQKQMLKEQLPTLKKVFLSIHLKLESIDAYFQASEADFYKRLNAENERAWAFLNNEEEAEKAGWNYAGSKKSIIDANNIKQIEWCHKAYPEVVEDLWLIDFEKNLLIEFMRSQA